MGRRSEVLVFSYDELQDPEVQLDIFGRIVPHETDVLPGFRVHYASTTSARHSGTWSRLSARATGNPLDKIIGSVLRLTREDMDASDEFEEHSIHRRIQARLGSDRHAWIYI